MSYLTENWSFDPFVIIVALLVACHEVGLAKLARYSFPEQKTRRRLRSLLGYAGLAILLIAVASPAGYWSRRYFFVHMSQYALLIFAAPALIVASAPWRPLRYGLPGKLGGDPARDLLAEPATGPIRAAARFLLRPWPAVVGFNLVLAFWLLPGPFDLAARSGPVQTWLLPGLTVAAGVVFWMQFIGSPPFQSRLKPAGQVTALLITNAVIWALSISMFELTRAPWSTVYHYLPGTSLGSSADQQLGAAILWVCGDILAVPTLVIAIRRLIYDDGGMTATIDRMLGRGSDIAKADPLAD